MTAGPVLLRYSRPSIRRDYWRAGAGLLMCAVLLALVTPGGPAFWVIAAFAAVFLAFGVHTALKHATIITLDNAGVGLHLEGPIGLRLAPRRIEFSELDGLTLRYFGRRRDRGRGIVELTLRGQRIRLTADQALEGFDKLVLRANAAAEAQGLTLDTVTAANLAALGYR